jgi:hypothetical protein
MRTSFKVLLPLLLLFATPAVMQAQFTFTTNADGTLTITKYTGLGGDVVIPASANGLPITSIGTSAFELAGIGSVTLPDSVTNIENGAFGGSLHSITFGTNATTIGFDAFSGCFNLTNVSIPDNVVSLGAGAFSNCSALTNVTIGNGVPNIGRGTFYQCWYLTNVAIGNGVTNIDEYAFYECYSLAFLTMGKQVTSIGESGFWRCFNLLSLTLPDSVLSLGNNAFYDCLSLTNVNFGQGVTSIGGGAFQECTNLTSITIPNSVTNLGSAFAGCTSLTNVVLGIGLTTVAQGTFDMCPKLSSVTLGPNLTSIGIQAFSEAPLTSIIIPSGVTNIGDWAFQLDSSLNGVFFLGNAPTAPADVFAGGNTAATVYYLPGTTGWGTNFGGLPTAVWLPQIQAADNRFGVKSNKFGFNINWASGMTVVVEASTNLANPIWSPVSANTLTSGSSYFSDPQWTNYPARFYRLRSP